MRFWGSFVGILGRHVVLEVDHFCYWGVWRVECGEMSMVSWGDLG